MSDTTEKQPDGSRDTRGRFAPGNQVGNRGGRPKGAKHKLSASFLNDLALHWQAEGGDILKRVSEDDPATVLRVIASLIPKEIVGRMELGDSSQGLVINFIGAPFFSD